MTTAENTVQGVETRDSTGYVWQVPGKVPSVHLSLDVVERMERQIIQSFKAITQRGSEIGGLLLGRMPANQSLVTVEDYQQVECDYARGPLYLLAEADKARLAAAIQRVKENSGKGLSVVGFFRSNTRRELAMDEDDLALMSEYFSEPRQVCLLVKPFSMKPSVAGFFIWETGKIQGQSSYLQFPFRRSELAKGERTGAPASAASPAAAAAAPGGGNGAQVAKPEIRSAPAAAPARRDVNPPAAAPRGEVRLPIPLTVPKREDSPAAAASPEASAPITAPLPKRETPAPPPPPLPIAAKPETRAAAPAVIPRRDAPVQAPVPAKPEARVTVPPGIPRREPPASSPAPRTEVRAPVSPVTPKREEPSPAQPEAGAPASPVAPRPAPTAAPPPKPAARTAIVSLGLLRPETLPAAPAPAPPPASRQEAAPASSTASRPEPPATVAAAPKREEAPTLAAGELPEPAEAAPATQRTRGRLPYAIAAVAALLLIAFGGLMYFRPGAARNFPAAAGPDPASLALRVERSAGQLLLSWNREAMPVKTAQAAVLSIFDGDHKEDVKLELNQLRSGSIVYSPITNDVSFKLELTDAKGQPVSETVRVIAGRPSPAAPLGQAPPPKPEGAGSDGRTRQETTAEQPSAATAETAAQPSPTPGGGTEPSGPAKPAPVQFRAQSLAARLSQAPNLPEPPGLEAQGASAPVRPGYGLLVPAPPPVQIPKPAAQESGTPPSAPAESAQSGAAGQPLRVGGNVQQALLVRSVTPVYPPLARQARVSGVVRVEATIGPDGRIVRAQAISGPPLLRQAATDAVRQWLYKPATLNGRPVEVVTQVDITFNLNR